MDIKNSFQLSACEEELLLSYLDGEAGFFSARRAKRLIQGSAEAQRFVDSILALSSRIGEWNKMQLEIGGKVDLWDRIERRIGEEERAAVFLGGREFASRIRQPKEKRESAFSKLFGPWAWSATAAAVAASLTFVLVQPTEQADLNLASNLQSTPRLLNEPLAAVGVNKVSYSEGMQQDHRDQMRLVYKRAKVRESRRSDSNAQRMLPAQMSQLTQVDWMRSDGQLLFVQEPRPGSTIIWVKRPKSQQSAAAGLKPRADRPVIFGESAVFPLSSTGRK